jgi:hypothetical protein
MMEHFIRPDFVPLFKRYQCRACKQWIDYSEADGRWHHRGDS